MPASDSPGAAEIEAAVAWARIMATLGWPSVPRRDAETARALLHLHAQVATLTAERDEAIGNAQHAIHQAEQLTARAEAAELARDDLAQRVLQAALDRQQLEDRVAALEAKVARFMADAIGWRGDDLWRELEAINAALAARVATLEADLAEVDGALLDFSGAYMLDSTVRSSGLTWEARQAIDPVILKIFARRTADRAALTARDGGGNG